MAVIAGIFLSRAFMEEDDSCKFFALFNLNYYYYLIINTTQLLTLKL